MSIREEINLGDCIEGMLRHYLVEGKDTSTDMVPMPTIDVGDA